MTSIPKLHISIVLYSTRLSDLRNCLLSIVNSFRDSFSLYLTFVDHSPVSMREIIYDMGLLSQIDFNYIFDPLNPGYGSGHNRALFTSIDLSYDFHLVLNPDIEFSSTSLQDLLDYMIANPSVGLVMPSVYSMEGQLQCLSKLIPHLLICSEASALPNFYQSI